MTLGQVFYFQHRQTSTQANPTRLGQNAPAVTSQAVQSGADGGQADSCLPRLPYPAGISRAQPLVTWFTLGQRAEAAAGATDRAASMHFGSAAVVGDVDQAAHIAGETAVFAKSRRSLAQRPTVLAIVPSHRSLYGERPTGFERPPAFRQHSPAMIPVNQAYPAARQLLCHRPSGKIQPGLVDK